MYIERDMQTGKMTGLQCSWVVVCMGGSGWTTVGERDKPMGWRTVANVTMADVEMA